MCAHDWIRGETVLGSDLLTDRTAIGLRVRNGVVLAVEKVVQSKLLVPAANRRIQTVDRHIGIVRPLLLLPRIRLNACTKQASAGLLADSRHIANRTFEEARSYIDLRRELPSVKVSPPTIPYSVPRSLLTPPSQWLAGRMGGYVQAYTLYSSVRPFGCSTIFAGADRSGPQLYLIEPSGVSYGYHGAAVGKGRQLAKTELEKLKLAEMSMREAVVEAARMCVFSCWWCCCLRRH